MNVLCSSECNESELTECPLPLQLNSDYIPRRRVMGVVTRNYSNEDCYRQRFVYKIFLRSKREIIALILVIVLHLNTSYVRN